MEDIDRERWRGGMDANMSTVFRELADLQRNQGEESKSRRDLELRVNTVATKIGLLSALGAFVGGGVMSIVVGLFLRH